jgi:hypothetical protein
MAGRKPKALTLVETEDVPFDGRNSPVEPDADPVADEMARLAGLGAKEMLEEARLASIRLLLAKVNTGRASAPEIAVLRNLLRDNGMILDMDDPEGTGGEVANPTGFQLPHLDHDDD